VTERNSPHRFVEANGLRFRVIDEGAGPAVLLLHGFPDTADLWREQIPALVSAGYRVIAPDLRGRGETEMPPRVEDYALSNVVRDVAGILDVLNVSRANVVGHDWGAGVAWLVAALLPERTDRLVAISVGYPAASGKPTFEALQKSWYRLLFLFEGTAERLLQQDGWYLLRELLQGAGDFDRYVADLSRPGRLTAGLNWYRANLPVERFLGPPPPLPAIQAPTLGIFSTGDNYLTEDRMIASASHVVGSWRYERVEGASHWVPRERPEWLNRLLIEHFSSNT
jgi:pimeloyl-ACP methyl ester carboxylesterase